MCLPPEWPWELPKHNACPRQHRPLATLSTRTGGGSAPLGRQGCTWVTLNASQGPGQDGVALEAPPPRGLRCACLVMCPRALGGCHALGTGHLCLLRQPGALAPKPAAGPARPGRDGSGPGYSLVPLVAIHVAVPSHQGGRLPPGSPCPAQRRLPRRLLLGGTRCLQGAPAPANRCGHHRVTPAPARWSHSESTCALPALLLSLVY